MLQKLGHQVTILTYYLGRDLPDLEIIRTRPTPWRADYEVGSSLHRIAFDAFLGWSGLKTVLRRRFEGLHIRVLPVPVQGEGAAERIAEALEDFNRHFPDTDLLLLGRGGGSIEDLWAFNEEVVARAIAACPVPVVSGVGHEVDTSDFHVEAIDLLGNKVAAEVGVAFFIAAYSVLRKVAPQPGLLVLGDMSIQGNASADIILQAICTLQHDQGTMFAVGKT